MCSFFGLYVAHAHYYSRRVCNASRRVVISRLTMFGETMLQASLVGSGCSRAMALPMAPPSAARGLARGTVSSGYEYEFVEAIARKYYCGICMKVLRDAQQNVCCGQHYCETCLKQWLASTTHGGKKSCPYCRTENFQSFPNKEKIREINEFKIYCSHRGKGCECMGLLEALKGHLESDNGCLYEVIRCTSGAYKCMGMYLRQMTCGVEMERRHFTHHQRNLCVYRQYTCEYCGYTDTYDAIVGSGQIRNKCSNISSPNNHFSECGNYPLDCPNGCGEKNIRRIHMNAHRDICPLEPLDCPLQYVGCSAGKIARGDMDSHCQENMQQHLLLVVQSNQQLVQSHQQLAQSHQQLAQSHQQLVGNNEELERNNEELARKVDELDIKIEAITKMKTSQSALPLPFPPPPSTDFFTNNNIQ